MIEVNWFTVCVYGREWLVRQIGTKFHTMLAVGLAVGLSACSSSEPSTGSTAAAASKKSGEGEGCTTSSDCGGTLKCIGATCVSGGNIPDAADTNSEPDSSRNPDALNASVDTANTADTAGDGSSDPDVSSACVPGLACPAVLAKSLSLTPCQKPMTTCDSAGKLSCEETVPVPSGQGCWSNTLPAKFMYCTVAKTECAKFLPCWGEVAGKCEQGIVICEPAAGTDKLSGSPCMKYGITEDLGDAQCNAGECSSCTATKGETGSNTYSSSSIDANIPLLGGAKPQLGTGMDSIVGQVRANCVDAAKQDLVCNDANGTAQVSIQFFQSASELRESFDFGLTVSYSNKAAVTYYSGEASMKYLSENKINEEDAFVVVKASVQFTPALTLKSPLLLAENVTLLQTDPAGFYTKCGNQFVASVSSGARITALYRFKHLTTSQKQALSGSLNIKAGGGTASGAVVASASSGLEKALQTHEFEFQYWQQGGVKPVPKQDPAWLVLSSATP